MKRRTIKRLTTAALSILLTTSMILPGFAEEMNMYDENSEYSDASDSYEDDIQTWDVDGNEESIPEITDSGDSGVVTPVYNDDDSSYSLQISAKRISFGKVSVGTVVKPQTVAISNTGKRAVNLIWKDVDPDCAFLADITQAQTIAPGEEKLVYITMTTNKNPGEYSGVLLFADDKDPGYTSGVKVDVTATVIDDSPIIKRVTISPSVTSATPGTGLKFSTEVEGEGDFDKSVSYSVTGNKSTDTWIDEKGLLMLGKNETAQTVTVVAAANGNKNVTASAKVEVKSDTYMVNVYSSDDDGGDVTGGGAYSADSRVVLRAYPENGWCFEGWEINGKNAGGGTTYTIDRLTGDVEAEAIFSQDSVLVEGYPNHKHMGKVEGSAYVDVGDSIVLKAIPEKGYRFSCWMEGKKKVSDEAKFKVKNVKKDREFTAVFVKNQCVVKVASSDETYGSVSGGKTVEYGKDITIKATPKKGYKFVKWVCNDKAVSDKAELTLPNIKDDITMVAIFDTEKGKKLCEFNAGTTDTNGVITPSGKVMVEEGKNVNFTITPKSGYYIAAIAIDGKQVAVTSSLTFSQVKGNHQIVAAFLPIQTPAKPGNNQQSSNNQQNNQQNNSQTAGNSSAIKNAEDSDINKEVKLSTQKVYDENIVDEKLDTENYIGDENDSLNNGLDEVEGTLQVMNITEEEAKEMLASDESRFEVMKQAVGTKELEINIDNGMRSDKFVMTYDDDALENPEAQNFASILCDIFTDEEILDLASGKKKTEVSVSVSPVKTEYVPAEQIQLFADNMPSGKKAGSYFYSNFIKTVDGVAKVVDEFSRPLQVTVDIPDNIYVEGRTYSVARMHSNGIADNEVTILEDIDNNPKTVTFTTDKFSTYAIVCDSDIEIKEEGAVNNNTDDKKDMVIVVLVAIVILLAGCIVVMLVIKKGRRRKHSR